jgi:glycine oxidase
MIAVIGAGIAGLSVAWELAKAGAEVAVFDAAKPGGGASGAATSYLEARLGKTPTRRLEQQAVVAWDAYAAALTEASGMDVGLRSDGQLRVALAEDVERFEVDIVAREAVDWPVRRMTPARAQKMEPLLGDTIAAAAHLPDVRYVNGAAVCAALVEALRKRSIAVNENRSVVAIEEGTLRFTDGERFRADAILLAAGLGINVIDGIPDDIPRLHPVRGVNLVFHRSVLPTSPAMFVKHQNGNMVPRGETMLVGTTYDRGVFDLTVSDETIRYLRANAAKIMPALADAPVVTTYAGLRTKTADGNLCIGRSRQNPRLHMSLGHAGSGFLRVPVLASALAQFILDGETEGPVAELLQT